MSDTYEKRLLRVSRVFAKRIGCVFVPDERWPQVIAAYEKGKGA